MDAAPLALTCGEPAGIGAEITLGAWAARHEDGVPFFLIDEPERLSALAARLGSPVPVEAIADPARAAAVFRRALPVLAPGTPIHGEPGRPDPRDAAAVVGAIRQAVALTLAGQAAAVVTNPIGKSSLKAAGADHPGHTEFLAELGGTGGRPVMLLASPSLKVVPVTIHLPLAAVPGRLTTALIVETGRIVAAAMTRDFALPRPRIAVLGLNPHAGEGGLLGTEETTLIAPAVAALRDRGVDAFGPVVPDAAFQPRARGGYDVALCMYHDQGLIPLKALDVDHGINVTLNLPFIRTSPDHGTALDIAGKGLANPASLIAALDLAASMAAARGAAPSR